MADDTSRDPQDEPDDLPILRLPHEGLTPVVSSPPTWHETVSALASGTTPIAVDVERAQSYRYSSKAYLVQVRREDAGTHLIDPVALERPGEEVADLSELARAVGDAEWIIHAATQDLPNLVQLGLAPQRLFDTELAGRLLGLPKVGLGPMVERYCGVRLLKEHAAVDWSIRPIPDDWLAYAALDVELLTELRQRLVDDLTAAGKDEWARQEFDWLITWAHRPRPERVDPWRRTSGTHTVRTRRGLALVRELWLARDDVARADDRAPSKILPDAAITELAALVPRQKPEVPTAAQLRQIEGFKRRRARQYQSTWIDVLDRVAAVPTSDLPPLRLPGTGIPAPRNWEKSNPEAWRRWEKVRPAVVALAEELSLPVENLLSPDALRHLMWAPDGPLTVEAVSAQLAGYDARPWQQALIAPLVVELLG